MECQLKENLINLAHQYHMCRKDTSLWGIIALRSPVIEVFQWVHKQYKNEESECLKQLKEARKAWRDFVHEEARIFMEQERERKRIQKEKERKEREVERQKYINSPQYLTDKKNERLLQLEAINNCIKNLDVKYRFSKNLATQISSRVSALRGTISNINTVVDLDGCCPNLAVLIFGDLVDEARKCGHKPNPDYVSDVERLKMYTFYRHRKDETLDDLLSLWELAYNEKRLLGLPDMCLGQGVSLDAYIYLKIREHEGD